MYTKDTIKRLSVRIEDSSNKPLGSGVLWTPNGESMFSYVFTAKHVIKSELSRMKNGKILSTLIIRYFDDDDLEFTTIVEDIGIDNECDYDVAVLKCRITNVDNYIYEVGHFNETNQNPSMLVYGFPKILHDDSWFRLSKQMLNGIFQNYDEQARIFQYDVVKGVDDSDRNKELVNYSGSGVFLENKGLFSLVGIHCKGAGSGSGLRTINCYEISCCIDICRDKEWDIPKLLANVDGDLRSTRHLALEQLDNVALKRKAATLVSNSYEDIINSSFCGYSEKCDYGSCYHKCESFRTHLLLIDTILKEIDEDIDLTSSKLFKNDIVKESGVKYICCDGYENTVRVSIDNFIKSIKLDYSKRDLIDNNSLVIWNSKISPRRVNVCESKEFDNIISDITLQLASEQNEFDIFTGESELEGIVIIHVEELVDKINTLEIEDFRDWVENKIKRGERCV